MDNCVTTWSRWFESYIRNLGFHAHILELWTYLVLLIFITHSLHSPPRPLPSFTLHLLNISPKMAYLLVIQPLAKKILQRSQNTNKYRETRTQTQNKTTNKNTKHKSQINIETRDLPGKCSGYL